MCTFAPAWPLTTERLLLRPFEPSDLEALVAMYSDEHVVRYLYHEARTPAQVHDLLAAKIAGAVLHKEGDWLSTGVVLRDSGVVVADLSLQWRSEVHRQGEIGFVVHPAHQGKGYATEASRPVMDFAFGALGWHRVIGRAEARNAASARVLEKLGMRCEAHLVENEWVKGEWQSEVIYAVLATEWNG